MLTTDLLKQKYGITTHPSKDKKGDLFVEFKGSDSFNYWYNSKDNKWIADIDSIEEAATELLDVLVNIEKLEIFPERVEGIHSDALLLIHRWYYTTPTVAFDKFLKQQERSWLNIRPWIGREIHDRNGSTCAIVSIDPNSGIVKFYVGLSGESPNNFINIFKEQGGVLLSEDSGEGEELYSLFSCRGMTMRFNLIVIYTIFEAVGFKPNPLFSGPTK